MSVRLGSGSDGPSEINQGPTDGTPPSRPITAREATDEKIAELTAKIAVIDAEIRSMKDLEATLPPEELKNFKRRLSRLMVNKALLGYEVSSLKETAKMAPLAQPTPPPATATHPSGKRKFPTTPPPQLPSTAPPRPPSIAKTAASTPEASATLAPKPGQPKPPLPKRPAPKPPSKPATPTPPSEGSASVAPRKSPGKPLPSIPQAYRERLVQKRRSDPPDIKQAREELQRIYTNIDRAKQFPSHEQMRKHILYRHHFFGHKFA